jgi:sulfotransferase family protein
MSMLTRLDMAGRSLVRKYFPRKSMSALGYDPYDKEACEEIATKLFSEMNNEFGSAKEGLETCQRIISIIGISYPSEKLAAAYFSNLETFLGDMRPLERSGQLVIGLGSGRCGSTSLAAMLGAITNSCCTHEGPPPIFWSPQKEQIEFHIRRFRMLIRFYSVVADVSHWWLNPAESVMEQFPEAKVIGLIRDPEDCAVSFMRIQGYGRGSYNPWVVRGNGFWRAGHWDPTYPSYALPSYAQKSPDRAKLELITRYVREYNAKLDGMARGAPHRVKLVRTEELDKETVQEEIFRFAEVQGRAAIWKLNVKGTADGRKIQIKF